MKMVFIIGGARSGKSSHALRMADQDKGPKAFLATAEALDEEMKERIERHRLERGDEWNTIEEPLKITPILRKSAGDFGVVVVDCLTIWLSNLLAKRELADPEGQTPDELIEEFVECLRYLKERGDSTLYLVSNEVGLGIVPDNKLARQFRDLAGRLNQQVAEAADEVYFVTAGIPVRIK